jgi:hypothetical protein
LLLVLVVDVATLLFDAAHDADALILIAAAVPGVHPLGPVLFLDDTDTVTGIYCYHPRP